MNTSQRASSVRREFNHAGGARLALDLMAGLSLERAVSLKHCQVVRRLSLLPPTIRTRGGSVIEDPTRIAYLFFPVIIKWIAGRQVILTLKARHR
jgi:hypothetical protein